ncbi:MAG: phosphoribosylformylglycinamidine cyclo-ligase [Cenarchaeum sp. SB0662_bin_33]|nr:phosphoribosylformylglycinamidine cyclo-ligase [Cenarchaeum sp. SB0662_bin_33]
MGITYKDAGVDINAIRKSQESIGRLIKTTHVKTPTIHGFGHYAGLVEIPGNMLLATHTDGVGTKVVIANMMRKFDTVGIDCIAMNVNDVICVGATPTSFVDYIAASRNEPTIFDDLIRGLSVGARSADVPIVGGETAIMTDMFAGDGFAFDLAGTVTGLVAKDRLVLGDDIQTGDVIVGAHSSGIHSNGYTLARNALFPRYTIHDTIRGVGRIGDALLTPTRIYVLPVLKILQECIVHGLAHITGGSFAKLSRLANVGFDVDSLPAVPPIMALIQEQGVDDEEMYKTFNMGVGFCVILPKDHADRAVSIFKAYDIESDVIGTITDVKGVRVNSCVLSYIG